MGEAELLPERSELVIKAHLVFYGAFATAALAEQLRAETEELWNEPQGRVRIGGRSYTVVFRISAECIPGLDEYTVLANSDPRANFFRIEDYAEGNISFVDGLGSNTGYFLLENLYPGSTTAAHEFGHTLGLDHPLNMDWRGIAPPGIMCARGTLVDPQFQYDPAVPAGLKGGTLHPMHRRVRQADIDDLRLDRLRFTNGKAIVGDFTNVYHWAHVL
ncbi:MAG: peptidase M10 [Chitinophagaceae bacterium]|nr:MAG: peptidase M10 [Chitinophagaceae bacterium]